jgi:hypothetical protein
MSLDPNMYERHNDAQGRKLISNSSFRLSIQHPDQRSHPPQYFSGNRGNDNSASLGTAGGVEAFVDMNRCFNSDHFDPNPANPNDVHSENHESKHYRWVVKNAASLDRISLNQDDSFVYLTCGPFDYGDSSLFKHPPPKMQASANGEENDPRSNFCRRVLIGGISTKVPGLPNATDGGVYTLRNTMATAAPFNNSRPRDWQFITPNFKALDANGDHKYWEIPAAMSAYGDLEDRAIVDGNLVLIRVKGEKNNEWMYLQGNQQSSLDEDGYYTVFTSKLPDTKVNWERNGWEFLWKIEVLSIGWFGGDDS